MNLKFNLNKKFYLYLLLYIVFIFIFIAKKDLLPLKKSNEILLFVSLTTLFTGIVYYKNTTTFVYSGLIFIIFIIFQLIKIYL